MTKKTILAIDQGTTSSRAIIFDHNLIPLSSAQQEFTQVYPNPGWVEHDPEEIWKSVVATIIKAQAKSTKGWVDINAIGITNQRETTVVWNRNTGECIYNAIVWQDRRTSEYCASLKQEGHETAVKEKTGLRLDPYFSATKLVWILDNVEGARKQAEQGELAFGTIDCFLLYRLTGGKSHKTDITNASRTLLYNIHEQCWDKELLSLFSIPENLLPNVEDCSSDFGITDIDEIPHAIPVLGIAGDQQAATIGQACFDNGMTKSTYGTGCFLLANTGTEAKVSKNRLLTTVAYRLKGEIKYALEGSIFVAGSAMQWLRDEMQCIETAEETEEIAQRTGIVEDVVVVPAFAGLGSPYWDPDARGAILGLTRGSNRETIITATLQSVALQTCDLIGALENDGLKPSVIRVDGGMAGNAWFLQLLADLLEVRIEKPTYTESTVLGAAFLAKLGCSDNDSLDLLRESWALDQSYDPEMPPEQRKRLLENWSEAVTRVRTD